MAYVHTLTKRFTHKQLSAAKRRLKKLGQFSPQLAMRVQDKALFAARAVYIIELARYYQEQSISEENINDLYKTDLIEIAAQSGEEPIEIFTDQQIKEIFAELCADCALPCYSCTCVSAPGITPWNFSLSNDAGTNPDIVTIDIVDNTHNICKAEYVSRFINECEKFQPQSGMAAGARIHTENKNSQYQNVKFDDQHDPYIYDVDSVVDPTRRGQDSDEATLQNFFSRPIKIHEEGWGTGLNLAFDIDPWSLYFDNARVSNRIANYNLLRANLHIKVVINGNGFLYGRALCAYHPFEPFDALSALGALAQDNIQFSQMPHIFLDPTTSSGGEMKLPFFHYANYLDIPTSEWSNLGKLSFRSLNDLLHANGASDSVTISVFAWAEDVSLSVLTTVEPDTIGPQSGEEIDMANKEGIVSGPATKIAKAASALSMIPQIKPFASATATIAGATAAAAKTFGYCRPPMTEAPANMVNKGMSSLALTNQPDTTEKLTVDDKQELSIDPRISGLGGLDPLNIKEIAKRESYLTKFTWAIGDAGEDFLWNIRVGPVVWDEVGTPTAYCLPACAYAALPFQYWTGTMKYRFQIVASSFHKGRLKFVYDPNFLATNEYNTNFIKIVDIAEEQDFTIEIGIGQAVSLPGNLLPGPNSVTEVFSTTAYAANEIMNGVLGVYVVNELTTPNSTVTNDIEINVFVSAGDDFEVFAPNDEIANYVFRPQSGTEIIPESQNTSEPSAPLQEESDTVGPGEVHDNLINQVFTGEHIASFRTMLKRYNLWSTFSNYNNDGHYYGRRCNFPYLRGNVSGAVDATAALDPYNYCNTVMLHWVVAAFSGWRGSIRYKVANRGSANNFDCMAIKRNALQGGAVEYDEGVVGFPIAGGSISIGRELVVHERLSTPLTNKPHVGLDGAAIQPTGLFFNTKPVFEFEVPYYSQLRFTAGREQNYTGTQTFTPTWDYYLEHRGDNASFKDIWVAAGEDFQCYFFAGMPRIYYEAAPPAA